jgi:DNA-binding transcriptional LysR family regulator
MKSEKSILALTLAVFAGVGAVFGAPILPFGKEQASSTVFSAIRAEALDPSFEVFLSWSQDIQRWHDSWWSPSQYPYIHLDSALMLPRYLEDPRCWALCPASVAHAFVQTGLPVSLHELKNPPPDRVCYYLTNRTPKNSATAAARMLFQRKLYDHLVQLQPLVHMEADAESLLDIHH